MLPPNCGARNATLASHLAAVSQGFRRVDTRGTAPACRWGHSAFMVEGTNKMVVYGVSAPLLAFAQLRCCLSSRLCCLLQGATVEAGSVGDCTVLNLST